MLAKLEKGHTRADFIAAAALCREAGLTLVPTFVAFTPWTTIDGYIDLLRRGRRARTWSANVAPVQWGIRLLVTWESRLLELPDIRAVIGPFDREDADVSVDAIPIRASISCSSRSWRWPACALTRSRDDDLRDRLRARRSVELCSCRSRSAIPYMNEPWYC